MHMSEPHPTQPYSKTGRRLGDAQFAQSPLWKNRDLMALVGMGVEPGFSDVAARYAADHLFSTIDEIGVRDGADLVVDGYDFAPTFSIWTTIEECLNPPVIYERERGWFTTEPFSEPEIFTFPEGIGPLQCVNVEHEEVILIPRWIDVDRVTFKYGLGDDFINVLKTLQKLDLVSTDPVEVRGVKVSPRDVVAAALPDPALLGDKMTGRTCAGTWVKGLGLDGEPREVYLYHIVDNAWSMKEFGHQAVVWQTAVMPAVAIELMATGVWSHAGVVGPEALAVRTVPRAARPARHRMGMGRVPRQGTLPRAREARHRLIRSGGEPGHYRSRMAYTTNGDCSIFYETFGSPDDPTLLMVNGLGSQCINYHEDWCAMFVDAGFHAIRFDNRDVGLSTHYTDAPVDDQGAAYRLSDMANDAIAVLDAVGVDRAHVMGLSMGGMIVQQLAIDHRHRLLSMVSVMSRTGEAEYGQSTPEALARLVGPPATDRASAIAGHIEGQRIWGSPAHADEQRWADDAARAFDRCFDPAGVGRQFFAVGASGSTSRPAPRGHHADAGDARHGRHVDRHQRRAPHRRADPGCQVRRPGRHGPRLPTSLLATVGQRAHHLLPLSRELCQAQLPTQALSWPIRGWARRRRCSKPVSYGMKPLRSG